MNSCQLLFVYGDEISAVCLQFELDMDHGYSFRILDTFGWNFRHAYYHEENRRTLIKAYGLKFLVVVDGRASKFDLKNTVIVLVTGLGLLGLSTMFCDFILLNYSTDRRRVSYLA